MLAGDSCPFSIYDTNNIYDINNIYSRTEKNVILTMIYIDLKKSVLTVKFLCVCLLISNLFHLYKLKRNSTINYSVRLSDRPIKTEGYHFSVFIPTIVI